MRTQTRLRPLFLTLSLIMILLMTGLSRYFFTRLDNIVHSDLYSFGLTFSFEWASQYWNYSRLTLNFLEIAMLIIGVAVAVTLIQVWTRKTGSAKLVTGILLVTGIIMFASSMYFFTRLDNIVHSDLYSFGLQFSYEWADQYWNHAKLMLGLLGVAIGLSGASLVQISTSTPIREIPLMLSPRPILEANLTKLTCGALTLTGATAIALSTYYNSSILAFIGLGLIFWGVILFYIRPEKYIMETLLDKTTLPSLSNLNQMIAELGFTSKGIYLPPRYFKNFETNKIYISAETHGELPSLEKTREDEDRIFIRNPNGALITPPGIELKRLFEKTLGTTFTRVDMQYLEQNIPKLLVEDLEIAQETDIKTENNRVFVKIKNSIYRNICEETQKLTKIHGSLGCPLCSAIACALAETTGKFVIIEQVQSFDEDQTTKIEYSLFEPVSEHTE